MPDKQKRQGTNLSFALPKQIIYETYVYKKKSIKVLGVLLEILFFNDRLRYIKISFTCSTSGRSGSGWFLCGGKLVLH